MTDTRKGGVMSYEVEESDFGLQSANQIGTTECKHICDTQKICPEIKTANCDDFFEKKCNCTVYCKKTL